MERLGRSYTEAQRSVFILVFPLRASVPLCEKQVLFEKKYCSNYPKTTLQFYCIPRLISKQPVKENTPDFHRLLKWEKFTGCPSCARCIEAVGRNRRNSL